VINERARRVLAMRVGFETGRVMRFTEIAAALGIKEPARASAIFNEALERILHDPLYKDDPEWAAYQPLRKAYDEHFSRRRGLLTRERISELMAAAKREERPTDIPALLAEIALLKERIVDLEMELEENQAEYKQSGAD